MSQFRRLALAETETAVTLDLLLMSDPVTGTYFRSVDGGYWCWHVGPQGP